MRRKRLPDDGAILPGEGRKRGGNFGPRPQRLYYFEEHGFTQRQLGTFFMILCALLEDRRKHKQDLEQQIAELDREIAELS